MEAPERRESKKTAGKTAAVLTALLLILCVISVAYDTYLKSNDSARSPGELLQLLRGVAAKDIKEAQLQYEFGYDAKERPEFAIFGEYIVKCSNAGIWLLDKKGETVWSQNMTMNSPVLRVSGKRLLVADRGGSDIRVIESQSVSWSERLDEPILNADISQGGYVTVITSSKRYHDEIRVFDPHGVELLREIIASDFAVSAKVTPSGDYLVVSGISTGAAGAYSSYKFYDMSGDEPQAAAFDETGELMPLFWFNKNGSVFAAGDKGIACLSSKRVLAWDEQYSSVLGASPAGSGLLAVAEESSGGTMLKLLTEGGKELSSGSLPGKPKNISAIKGAIAVSTVNTVSFYDSACQNYGKYNSGSKIRQVLLFSRSQAVVVTEDGIRVIHIG